MNELIRRTIRTPVGRIVLFGDGAVVERIYFGEVPISFDKANPSRVGKDAYADACTQLDEYFAGRRRIFTFPMELKVDGFRRDVLEALKNVAFGRTVSYSELAALAGSKGASRAVGTACAQNPLPIVIPCHRVLKSDGSLGEFGGGPEVKRKLLDLEGASYLEKTNK